MVSWESSFGVFFFLVLCQIWSFLVFPFTLLGLSEMYWLQGSRRYSSVMCRGCSWQDQARFLCIMERDFSCIIDQDMRIMPCRRNGHQDLLRIWQCAS